jgi:hypothetical protein
MLTSVQTGLLVVLTMPVKMLRGVRRTLFVMSQFIALGMNTSWPRCMTR